MRIHVVVARRAHAVDAIRSYAEHLVDALNAHGEKASLGFTSLIEGSANVALVQYNPFSFGRWGVAPRLLVWAARMRFSRSRAKLVLMVHEPYVAITSPRTCLMAAWQRPQLLLLRMLATSVLAPSVEQARRCGARLRSTRVVPAGSNLPDARHSRDTARHLMGIGASDVVLVSFGASPAGRRQEMIAGAATEVASRNRSCVLLVLGTDNVAPLDLSSEIRVIRPGHLDDEELARHLAAGDLLLAPYVDGVSTRRTALMAALQHAIAVVGTAGPQSDPVLVESDGLVTVPTDALDDFARAAGDLAADEHDRKRRSAAARALFEREFAWNRIADRLVAQLQ